MADIEVPVLIVGGSLVGMSTALLLGHHGIRALAVEHHRGTAIHPRAAQITQRTMEIFRTVGIEQIVRQKSDEQFVQDGAIMAVETLAGQGDRLLHRQPERGHPRRQPHASASSSRRACSSRCSRHGPRNSAPSCGSAPTWSRSSRTPDGVTAVIRDRDSGRDRDRARVVHGGRRRRPQPRCASALGIAMHGRGVFSNSVTIYFRADVAPLLRGRNLSVIYVNNPALRGFFRFEKPFDRGFLAVNALGDPGQPDHRCRRPA